jgi:hypothetical protein
MVKLERKIQQSLKSDGETEGQNSEPDNVTLGKTKYTTIKQNSEIPPKIPEYQRKTTATPNESLIVADFSHLVKTDNQIVSKSLKV